MDPTTYGRMVEHGDYPGRYQYGLDLAAPLDGTLVIHDQLLGHTTVETFFGTAQVDMVASAREAVDRWVRRLAALPCCDTHHEGCTPDRLCCWRCPKAPQVNWPRWTEALEADAKARDAGVDELSRHIAKAHGRWPD